FLLCTPMSSNLNNKRIPPQDFVCNLSHARQGVIDSIDTLITNC
ncbi:TPA: plasmid maintenance protein CcdB, partial [Klebsiella pneumoniae]